MSKLIQGFGILVLTGIVGCGNSTKEPIIHDGTGGQGNISSTRPLFKPGEGKIPLPNDFLFKDTADFTLNPPVADATDFSDPTVALSAMDGWSATAPFSIAFVNELNTDPANPAVTLNKDTILPGKTIRLFKVNVKRPEVSSGIPAPTGAVTGVEKELVAGVDFVAALSGQMSVAVIPLKPLVQQASYMVVLTNGIKDSSGNSTFADRQYAITQTTTPIPEELPTGPLEGARKLVNAMENAAEVAGQPKADITLSFQFTVEAVGAVVVSSKMFYIDGAIAQGQVPTPIFSSLMTDTTIVGGMGAADLHKGEINLNYFLTAPTAEKPTAVVSEFFHGAAMVPVEGRMMENPLAGKHTSYANKLPQVTGIERVPLLVALPKHPSCSKPYAVTIFQHGITSDRTAMLSVADSLAGPGSCNAVIAMDKPIHGIAEDNGFHQLLLANGKPGVFAGYSSAGVRERTFGVDYVNNDTGAPGPDGKVDESGKHFINLKSLLTVRDNGRQAILDLLALEKAIKYMDIDGGGTDFDETKISFVAHSLGAMTGVGFLGYSDNIKSAVLMSPGSGIALLLDGSPYFGPSIHAGLAAAGIERGTADYAKFMFVAQTVVDTIDPASLSAFAKVNNVPVLIMHNDGDVHIPSTIANAPQSGNTPLTRFMDTETISVTEAGFVAGNRLFARFNIGDHKSALVPTENRDLTIEMQTQMVTFLNSPAATKGVQVSRPEWLAQ